MPGIGLTLPGIAWYSFYPGNNQRSMQRNERIVKSILQTFEGKTKEDYHVSRWSLRRTVSGGAYLVIFYRTRLLFESHQETDYLIRRYLINSAIWFGGQVGLRTLYRSGVLSLKARKDSYSISLEIYLDLICKHLFQKRKGISNKNTNSNSKSGKLNI